MKRLMMTGFCGTLMALALAAGVTAAVPGPNGLIAFRAVNDNGSGVYTIDPSNPLDQLLLHDFDGDVASAPHYSPDLRMFTFEVDTADTCANVVTMDATGANVNVLPLANGDVCEGAPTFSADGTRIVYDGFNGHRDRLFSMNLDGSDRQLVTACQGRGVTSPEASPDGKMLAFTCTSRDGSALFVSNVNGSRLRQLTPYSAQVGFHEDWSPDSRRIMFITVPNEGTPQAQVNTWTINADGSDLFQVTHYPAGGLRVFGNSYSPDGQWIVLRIEDGDQYALFKIHPDGNGLTQITDYSSFRPRGMVWTTECPCSP